MTLMYLPNHFREDRQLVLHELMRAHNFAALVTTGPGGLTANHLPLLLDAGAGPHGTLRGHLARANPQCAAGGGEALVIFQGPHHYISPSWYPSKEEHGRVVPTWNYAVVHAYGKLTTFDDPARLRGVVEQLTEVHEASVGGTWKVADAPEGFIDGMLAGITGVEIVIDRLEGKWKMSQNRPESDREGVLSEMARLKMDRR